MASSREKKHSQRFMSHLLGKVAGCFKWILLIVQAFLSHNELLKAKVFRSVDHFIFISMNTFSNAESNMERGSSQKNNCLAWAISPRIMFGVNFSSNCFINHSRIVWPLIRVAFFSFSFRTTTINIVRFKNPTKLHYYLRQAGFLSLVESSECEWNKEDEYPHHRTHYVLRLKNEITSFSVYVLKPCNGHMNSKNHKIELCYSFRSAKPRDAQQQSISNSLECSSPHHRCYCL